MMKTPLVLAMSVVLAAGAVAANRLGAQTTGSSNFGVPPASTVLTQDPTTRMITPSSSTTTPTTTATTTATTTTVAGQSAGEPVTPSTAGVQNIVEITRLVPAGPAAVTAFTVPADVVLIVTDVIVTNTGAAATCGGAVNRSGAAAPTSSTSTPPPAAPTDSTLASTATLAGTLTRTDSTVTGPLCVPAQTTMTLPLTTGIEFAAGQSVQLMNTPDPTVAPGTTAGPLGFHLRGLLVTVT